MRSLHILFVGGPADGERRTVWDPPPKFWETLDDEDVIESYRNIETDESVPMKRHLYELEVRTERDENSGDLSRTWRYVYVGCPRPSYLEET